jgi:hypothetical protein
MNDLTTGHRREQGDSVTVVERVIPWHELVIDGDPEITGCEAKTMFRIKDEVEFGGCCRRGGNPFLGQTAAL